MAKLAMVRRPTQQRTAANQAFWNYLTGNEGSPLFTRDFRFVAQQPPNGNREGWRADPLELQNELLVSLLDEISIEPKEGYKRGEKQD